jgi:hypothetical protein
VCDFARKQRRVKKFLLTLFDNGGELSRSDVTHKLFRNHITKFELDELLASPELNDLFYATVVSVKCPNEKTKRRVRYYLSIAGWKLMLAGPRKGIAPPELGTERVQAEFERLCQKGDRWAIELAKDAQEGRKRLEDWRQEQAQAAADRKAAILAKSLETRQRHAAREAAAAEEERRAHPDAIPKLPVLFGSKQHTGQLPATPAPEPTSEAAFAEYWKVLGVAPPARRPTR